MGICEQRLNKEGICISESLGLCKGCSSNFLEDLKEDGFKGIFINEKGEKINF